MITIEVVLLILALICFLLSTVSLVARVNLQSLGLAFLALALLLRGHIVCLFHKVAYATSEGRFPLRDHSTT